jgi:hypothetical protein
MLEYTREAELSLFKISLLSAKQGYCVDEMEKPFDALLSVAIDQVPDASKVVVVSGAGFGSLFFLQLARIVIKRNE